MSYPSSSQFQSFVILPLFAGLMATLMPGCNSQEEAGPETRHEEAAGELDFAKMVSVAEAEALLGDTIREPRADGPRGIVLGRCSWSAENNGRSLAIWAYPISMWEKATAVEGAAVEEGMGARAVRLEDGGLYVDPGKREYFLQVFVIDTDGSISRELTDTAAKLVLN